MKGNMLMVFLLASSIGLALSSPVQPNYDNIPQCMQPAESGLCLAYFLSYYYNPSEGKCLTFVYGGCRGNANRFLTFDECMAKCGGFKPESNESFKLVLESDEEEGDEEKQEQSEENTCFQPSVMGPCRAMMPRFYFNGDKCESFIYGGCQGNENNFKTVEECQQKCGTKTPEEVGEISEENSEENSDGNSDENSEESSS